MNTHSECGRMRVPATGRGCRRGGVLRKNARADPGPEGPGTQGHPRGSIVPPPGEGSRPGGPGGKREMAVAAAKSSRRTASREERRQQLILATIKCISRKGIGSVTLADVAQEAGLSQGIVNLHFRAKENLLNETLQYLAEDYKAHFYSTLEKAGPEAAEKLLALMEMDLKPSICDRQKLAVWFAFWGEVKSVPTYQKICEAYDR